MIILFCADQRVEVTHHFSDVLPVNTLMLIEEICLSVRFDLLSLVLIQDSEFIQRFSI